MSFIRESIGDTSKYLIFRIISILTGVITIPIIARVFKAEEFGVYSIIITSISIYTLVSSEWIKSSFLRFYHEYKHKDNLSSLISTSIAILFIIDSVVVIIAFFLNVFLHKLNDVDFIFLILLIFASTFQSIAINYFRIKQQIIKFNIFQLLPKVTFFLIFLPLVYFNIVHNNIRAIIFSGLFANFFVLLYTLKKFHSNHYLSLKRIKYNLCSIFEKYGIPIAFTALISVIFSSSDRYIIFMLAGKGATGIYSFAYNLANKSFVIIPQTIGMALWPIILKYSEKDFDYTFKKIFIIQKLYFLIVFPLAILIDIFSKEIFRLIAVGDYLEGALFFKYIIYGLFIGSLVWYFNVFFMLKKNTRILMWAYLVAAVVNVGLNFLLIPKYGYQIAAVTTLISYMVYFVIMAFVTVKEKPEFLGNIKFIFAFSLLMYILIQLDLKITHLLPFQLNDFLFKLIAVIPIVIVYLIFISFYFRRNKEPLLE